MEIVNIKEAQEEPKNYLVNSVAMNDIELIEEACKVDFNFSKQLTKKTSEAAGIIRLYGGTVEDNFINDGI